ncbi:MAG: hypothetical protein ACPIOQ_84360, partial [Promethearchaeia archaeon]
QRAAQRKLFGGGMVEVVCSIPDAPGQLALPHTRPRVACSGAQNASRTAAVSTARPRFMKRVQLQGPA